MVSLEGRAYGFTLGPSSSRFSQLEGAVVIAGHRFDCPFVQSNALGEFSVGSGMLKGYALSIDQRSGLARLDRSPRNAESMH